MKILHDVTGGRAWPERGVRLVSGSSQWVQRPHEVGRRAGRESLYFVTFVKSDIAICILFISNV